MQSIGIDEVGRGCLWGPVVACALTISSDNINIIKQKEEAIYKMITDSKKLSSKKRQMIKNALEPYVKVGYGLSSSNEIDETNILKATMLAMHRSIDKLIYTGNAANAANDVDGNYTCDNYKLMVDGNKFTPYKNYEYETIVGGDGKVLEISLASIFAKEYRDSLVMKAVEANPELNKYDLSSNMGYGTKVHCNALMEYGYDQVHHRKSFAKVREINNVNSFILDNK